MIARMTGAVVMASGWPVMAAVAGATVVTAGMTAVVDRTMMGPAVMAGVAVVRAGVTAVMVSRGVVAMANRSDSHDEKTERAKR